jgi:predicted nucleic acid-binding protein
VKVTVDINVLLDVFQKREPHYAASAQVVRMIAAGTVEGVCPAHGLTTLFYLVRKYASKPDAESAMDQVLHHFQIGNLDAAAWQEARRLPFADFEDAVVATVATATASDFIITRNVGDFAASPVSAITPADFLSQLTAAR